MISAVLYRLQAGVAYLRHHPKIILSLILLVVIPLLFLVSGEQFLKVAKSNYERLEIEKIGLLHDAYTAVIHSADSAADVQVEIDKLVSQNPDITVFTYSTYEQGAVVPLAAYPVDLVGEPVPDIALFQSAAVRNDESIVYKTAGENGRTLVAFRAIQNGAGQTFFIATEHDLSAIDSAFAAKERSAYIMLAFLYVLLLAVAYWQVKNTDYQSLFEETKKANQTKDLMTNMIAHELRAPLTAIRGYASLIDENSNLDAKTRSQAHKIQVSAERLLLIVNDLLDVARIQSGKLKVSFASCDLAALINTVADELHVNAAEKNIEILTEGTDTSSTITTDEKRLQQILTNLVSNAIKYTEKGSITLALSVHPDKAEIRIKDTGMGISAADQQKLFAPFYRVESQAVNEITGTGLGMWITKQLTELIGGGVAVESIKGVGTHLVVTLPKTIAVQEPA